MLRIQPSIIRAARNSARSSTHFLSRMLNHHRFSTFSSGVSKSNEAEPVVDMTVRTPDTWHPASFIGDFVSNYVFKDHFGKHFTKEVNPEMIRTIQQAQIYYDRHDFDNALKKCDLILKLSKPDNKFAGWGQCADVAFALRRKILLITGKFPEVLKDFAEIYVNENLSSFHTFKQVKLFVLKCLYHDLLMSIRSVYPLVKDDIDVCAPLIQFVSQLPLSATKTNEPTPELCESIKKMFMALEVPHLAQGLETKLDVNLYRYP